MIFDELLLILLITDTELHSRLRIRRSCSRAVSLFACLCSTIGCRLGRRGGPATAGLCGARAAAANTRKYRQQQLLPYLIYSFLAIYI